jgi:hypothetical protein
MINSYEEMDFSSSPGMDFWPWVCYPGLLKSLGQNIESRLGTGQVEPRKNGRL